MPNTLGFGPTVRSVESNGDQNITDLSVAVPLTIPDGTTEVWIQAQVVNARMRIAGDPTASLGMILETGWPPIRLEVEYARLAKFIQVEAGGVLFVEYLTGISAGSSR